MIDIEKLKGLAEAAKEDWCNWWTIQQLENRAVDGAGAELIVAANPAALLELIDRVKHISARLCMCRDCGGQGEVYSGHSTYQGHWQPPEPDMNICPACGGDGVLGPLEDFEALATERDQLKAENEALQDELAKLRKLQDGRHD